MVHAVFLRYELYYSCSIVKFLMFALSIQHPHTLRLENTIAQLSQNTCNCFNSCYEAQYHNGFAHITLRNHEGHMQWYYSTCTYCKGNTDLHNNILKKWIT